MHVKQFIECRAQFAILVNKWLTWRYLSCNAAGDWAMTIEASLRALEAFCSPSAAITLARASRAASASAAIARCSCTGRRTSLLHVLKNAIMNDYQRMNKAPKKKKTKTIHWNWKGKYLWITLNHMTSFTKWNKLKIWNQLEIANETMGLWFKGLFASSYRLIIAIHYRIIPVFSNVQYLSSWKE